MVERDLRGKYLFFFAPSICLSFSLLLTFFPSHFMSSCLSIEIILIISFFLGLSICLYYIKLLHLNVFFSALSVSYCHSEISIWITQTRRRKINTTYLPTITLPTWQIFDRRRKKNNSQMTNLSILKEYFRMCKS